MFADDVVMKLGIYSITIGIIVRRNAAFFFNQFNVTTFKEQWVLILITIYRVSP